MIYSWKERISDWNPQLIRELKGRLKPKTVLVAIALSLLMQFLIFGSFYSQLPIDAKDYSRYCQMTLDYSCQLSAGGFPLINWELWWTDIFRFFNWLIPYALMAPGTFMLAANLEQEERSGTLNFIRLSPQTARDVLLGKLLGVPVLVYIAVALVAPLHIFAGLSAHLPAGLLVSFYAVLLVASFFIFSAALLLGFQSKAQHGTTGTPQAGITGFIAALITVTFFVPGLMMWNSYSMWRVFTNVVVGWSASTDSGMQWFYLPLSDNAIIGHLFTLGNLAFITYWIWRVLERCFHIPGATMISKGQSYGLVAYWQILMIGLCVHDYNAGDRSLYISQIAMVLFVTTIGFLALIAMLSNHRQSLLDWARYRHVQSGRRPMDEVDEGATERRSLWHELVWGERSPATVAILINLLIVAVITLPWIVFVSNKPDLPWMLLGLLVNLSLIALYAAIAQLALLGKNSKRAAIAFSSVGLVFLIPLFMAIVTNGSISSSAANRIFALTPVVWAAVYNLTPISTLLFSLLGQWSVTVLLNLKLVSQLKQLGKSQSQALFAQPQIAQPQK